MKYRKEVETETGWSEWIQPLMTGYRMACCDCGSVHDMEFRVVEVVEEVGKGFKETVPTPEGQFLVHFRARRNNRATGQKRRGR